MKRKMITSLILTVFIAVMVLCFIHTAIMMVPMITDGCVLIAEQSMCPIQMISSWRDLFAFLPQINLTLLLIFLAGIVLFGVTGKQIGDNNLLKPLRLYSETYPNFSSLNFLNFVLRRGILHPKLF